MIIPIDKETVIKALIDKILILSVKISTTSRTETEPTRNNII